MGFAMADGVEFEKSNTTQCAPVLARWIRYGQSKLANILYACQLADKNPELSVGSVHPGVIATDLLGTLGCIDRLVVYAANIGQMVAVEQGVMNSIWAASVDRRNLMSGEFYEPVGTVGRTTKASKDDELANRSYEWTQALVEG